LFGYNTKHGNKLDKHKFEHYLDKLTYKATNKFATVRTKFIKRIVISKLIKNKCKLKGGRLIKVKSLKPSEYERFATKKLK